MIFRPWQHLKESSDGREWWEKFDFWSNLHDHQPSIMVKMLFEMSFFKVQIIQSNCSTQYPHSFKVCSNYLVLTMLVKMKSNKVNWMVLSRRPLPLLAVHVLQLVSPFSSYFPPNVVAELSTSLWDESMQGQTRHSTLLWWADLRAWAEGECYKFSPLGCCWLPLVFYPGRALRLTPGPPGHMLQIISHTNTTRGIGDKFDSRWYGYMVGHLNSIEWEQRAWMQMLKWWHLLTAC